MNAYRLPVIAAAVLRERSARDGRPRVPEPMTMETPQAVAEFHAAGARLNVPMYELCARGLHRLVPPGGRLLDLGSGSGRLLAHLARRRPDVSITGVDLSAEMIRMGTASLRAEGLHGRVKLVRGDITDLPDELLDGVDAVSCVWTVHHLPTDELIDRLLATLAAARRRTGAMLWLADFARLRHSRTWPAVFSLVPSPGPALTRDALASERAALTYEELIERLRRAGLGDLEHRRSRPLGWLQAHWTEPAGSPTPDSLWNDFPLPRVARMATRRLLASMPLGPSEDDR